MPRKLIKQCTVLRLPCGKFKLGAWQVAQPRSVVASSCPRRPFYETAQTRASNEKIRLHRIQEAGLAGANLPAHTTLDYGQRPPHVICRRRRSPRDTGPFALGQPDLGISVSRFHPAADGGRLPGHSSGLDRMRLFGPSASRCRSYFRASHRGFGQLYRSARSARIRDCRAHAQGPVIFCRTIAGRI